MRKKEKARKGEIITLSSEKQVKQETRNRKNINDDNNCGDKNNKKTKPVN